jgi:hypothetical protein
MLALIETVKQLLPAVLMPGSERILHQHQIQQQQGETRSVFIHLHFTQHSPALYSPPLHRVIGNLARFSIATFILGFADL